MKPKKYQVKITQSRLFKGKANQPNKLLTLKESRNEIFSMGLKAA